MSDIHVDKKKPLRIEHITPILNVRDIAVSRDFYITMLGFKEADWGDNTFTCLERDNAAIYLCKGGQGHPGTWIWVGFDGDMLSFFNELKAKGAFIRQPPVNYPWALEMHIEDPDGHVLRFGTDPHDNEPFSNEETSAK